MSFRQEAKKNGFLTYTVTRRCIFDGDFTRYTDSGECCSCVAYRNAIKSGRIEGIDGRTSEMKASGKVPKANHDKWSEEMSQMHSAAIKRGWARRKKNGEA